MPSVNKTETIQLNQWQSNEYPKMDDFNSDNLKIDNKFKVHDTQLSELTNKVDNIKIADGTTNQKGIVKLNDTVTSTSIIEAATANAVRQAYARADSAFQYANNGKTSIANIIGYVTGSNTHVEIANEIQNDKNILATTLTNKNVNANGNFALKDLVNKVSEISVASLGGRNFASNTAVTSSSTKAFPNTCGSTTSLRYFSIRGLPFVPSIIIGWNSNNQYYSIYSSSSIFGAGVLYNEYRTGSTSGGGGSIVPIANSASVQISASAYDIPIQQYAGYNVSWWAFG